jgi:GcrA cell cycle regulator
MTDSNIAELWSEGLPLSEIGDRLGVSRGVIAGHISRARKAGDARFAPRPPKPRARKLKPIGEAVGAVRRAPAPVEKPRAPRLLIDLGPLDCRWPVGEAADGRHLFCGQARAPRRPYCPQCCARLSSSLAPLHARG